MLGIERILSIAILAESELIVLSYTYFINH